MTDKKHSTGLPNLISISEAARLLNVHPETLRRWDNKGVLEAVRIGPRKDRRYKKETILKLLDKGLEE
jgi:excisionase family DNA binding protein